MRLTKLAIMALRGAGKRSRQVIAEALNVAESTVYRWISDNDENLTKAAALEVIRKETGLSDDQILEREESTVE